MLGVRCGFGSSPMLAAARPLCSTSLSWLPEAPTASAVGVPFPFAGSSPACFFAHRTTLLRCDLRPVNPGPPLLVCDVASFVLLFGCCAMGAFTVSEKLNKESSENSEKSKELFLGRALRSAVVSVLTVLGGSCCMALAESFPSRFPIALRYVVHTHTWQLSQLLIAGYPHHAQAS